MPRFESILHFNLLKPKLGFHSLEINIQPLLKINGEVSIAALKGEATLE